MQIALLVRTLGVLMAATALLFSAPGLTQGTPAAAKVRYLEVSPAQPTEPAEADRKEVVEAVEADRRKEGEGVEGAQLEGGGSVPVWCGGQLEPEGGEASVPAPEGEAGSCGCAE